MRVLIIPLLLGFSVALISSGQAAGFTVTKTTDGGPGSLRQAIVQSNSNGAADTITFAAGLAGKMIQPRRPLPALTEGRLTINGHIDANGTPDIVLSGAVCGGTGIDVRSRENTIRGLAIRHFDKGVAVFGAGAVRNQVAGCYVGTDLKGRWALANNFGVYISGAARYNTIGGTVATDRNVISGNIGAGVAIVASDSNKVFGNFIGLNRYGTRALPNSVGVLISDCETCRIGNGTVNGRNIISANTYQEPSGGIRAVLADLAFQAPIGPVGGIYIFRGARHRVLGNFIGTDVSGSLPRGNRGSGIGLVNSVGVTIGGTIGGTGNLVSDNGEGIWAEGSHATTIRGNYVGLNANGNRVVGDQSSGIGLEDCTDSVVGGTAAGARNVVSGNQWAGIRVSGGYDNSVLGNYVGLDASGTEPLGTGQGIIANNGARRTWIGNQESDSGNAIAAADQAAISIEGYGTQDTRVMRNNIGTNAAGSRHLPGRQQAIRISYDAGAVTVGGNVKARGNKIAAMAGQDGIYLDAEYASDSMIRHNTILGPGGPTPGQTGIRIALVSGWPFGGFIADNTIRRFNRGLSMGGPAVRPVVAGNRFNKCVTAIHISDGAAPNLGDLGNGSTIDDGGNVFGTLVNYAVQNWSSQSIKAEGNDWGTTSAAIIDGTLIYDQLDNIAYGRVDYDPLIGNVTPTSIQLPLAQVTGLLAAPTGIGADIAFALSTPAEVGVEVLNIAGRPVARIRPRAAEAGLNRMAWNGMSETGTRAPGGMYLVRVTARTDSGEETSALATLRLGR